MVAPDCPFDILSASSSGSARRLLVVTGLTGSVVNADALYVPDRRAAAAAITTSVLFIGAPIGMSGCRLRADRSSPRRSADRYYHGRKRPPRLSFRSPSR